MPRIGAEISRADVMDDALAKNPKNHHPVIPAQAGGKRVGETPIQCPQVVAERLDPGLRRGDGLLRALHG